MAMMNIQYVRSLKMTAVASTAAFLCSCQMNTETLTPVNLSSFAAPPETVSITIKSYNPQAGNALQNIFVSNLSVKAGHGQLEWSTARDGLSDTVKTNTFNIYGFSSDSPESVVPGYADLVLYGAGINLTNYGQMACNTNKFGSSSNDMIIYNDDRYGNAQRTLGLRDCVKSYLGLNASKFDNNANGIPDYLELRCGMNPLSASTAYASTAGDGVANIDKCKMNIPIAESMSSQSSQTYAYKYKQTNNPLDGSIEFNISNIPILRGGDENLIVFYITEVNKNTGTTSLYTAYAVLKAGYNGKTLQFNYWATSPANFFNQQVVVPAIP
jgi:hypothetical protein